MMKEFLKDEKFREMKETLKVYMRAKSEYDEHIVRNNDWYRKQYMENIRMSSDGEIISPTTGFLFNALASKHADAMDAYPTVTLLERTPEGRAIAKKLSSVLPFELERTDFRKTYSRGWWYKLKHGAAAYGVFYHPEEDAVKVSRLDILNICWAPGIEDIQDSPYLFTVTSVPKKDVEARYPEAKDGNLESDFQLYRQGGSILEDGFVAVVDCYEKIRNSKGKEVVHLTKFCGDELLDSTYLHEETYERGLYDHGKYPIVMDVLYPIDGSPVGFGLVDIAKNPQSYIDKLDDIISRNALAAGKMRYMVKDNGGVNEEELLDMNQDLIHVAGGLGEENIRAFQTRALDPYIIEHRQNKIGELKEITGNRDVTGGGVSGNVTGFNAITALQSAGQKMMRDMVYESYTAFGEIMRMYVELMRQFYGEEHLFCVEDEAGERSFVRWLSKEENMLLAFDVRLTPARPDDSRQETVNNLAVALFEKGFFDPERKAEAEIALRMMEFPGKVQVEAMLKE